MKFCDNCGKENSATSNFCQPYGKKMNSNNTTYEQNIHKKRR